MTTTRIAPVLFLLPLLLAVGCAPIPIAYMASPVGTPSPKPTACDFEVRSSLPATGYTEVGTLTFGSRTLTTYRASRIPEEFKEAVRSDVCALGGDVVTTEVDRQGTIVRATVLRAQSELQAAE